MSESNEQLLIRLRRNGVVRQKNDIVSIYDVMKRAGVGREPSHVLPALTHVIDFDYTFHKFPGQGSRVTPAINVCHLRRLLEILPSNGVRKFLFKLDGIEPRRQYVPNIRSSTPNAHKHFYIRRFPNLNYIKIGITRDIYARHKSYNADGGQMSHWMTFTGSDICVATHIEKILKAMFAYMTVNSRDEYLDLELLSGYYGVDTVDEACLCLLAEAARLQSKLHPQVAFACFERNVDVQIQLPTLT